MSIVRRRTPVLTLATLVVFGTTGCASMSNTEKGAAAGAGAGGAVGAIIGDAAGSTAKGAIIGAVVGGTAGALIGQRMDQKAETLDDNLDDAEVERVGEGILVTFDSGILFDFDSADLRPEARANLTELSDALAQESGDYSVLVVGHTDSVGRESYNLQLSERRASAAANYLAGRGISPSRIQTEGMGETEPVATNETEAGRQENRRVEVAIYASEDYRDQMLQRHGG